MILIQEDKEFGGMEEKGNTQDKKYDDDINCTFGDDCSENFVEGGFFIGGNHGSAQNLPRAGDPQIGQISTHNGHKSRGNGNVITQRAE